MAEYCCQVGLDLGNLMFASSVLVGTTNAGAANLSPFLNNLQNSSIRIGEPEVLREFIGFCEGLLSSSKENNLANVSGKAATCAQKLAIWIETNISLQETEGTAKLAIPGFLEGIPYIGKGLAELYKARKEK